MLPPTQSNPSDSSVQGPNADGLDTHAIKCAHRTTGCSPRCTSVSCALLRPSALPCVSPRHAPPTSPLHTLTHTDRTTEAAAEAAAASLSSRRRDSRRSSSRRSSSRRSSTRRAAAREASARHRMAATSGVRLHALGSWTGGNGAAAGRPLAPRYGGAWRHSNRAELEELISLDLHDFILSCGLCGRRVWRP